MNRFALTRLLAFGELGARNKLDTRQVCLTHGEGAFIAW
jgi:hypothetical protein